MKKVSLLSLCFLLTWPVGQTVAAGLAVSGAWIPEAPPVAKVMAGYLTIKNNGSKPVTIKTVKSPDFGAIEMHETVTEDGFSKMIRHTSLTIEPGKQAVFQHGGMHLMLFRPQHAMKQNDLLTITLETSDGPVSFQAKVKPATLDEDHSHQH